MCGGSPASHRLPACTASWWVASMSVAFSARRKAIAWRLASGLPKVVREWARHRQLLRPSRQPDTGGGDGDPALGEVAAEGHVQPLPLVSEPVDHRHGRPLEGGEPLLTRQVPWSPARSRWTRGRSSEARRATWRRARAARGTRGGGRPCRRTASGRRGGGSRAQAGRPRAAGGRRDSVDLPRVLLSGTADEGLDLRGQRLLPVVGLDRESTWKALLAGRSGVGPITAFDASELPVRIAAEVRDFDPEAVLHGKRLRRSAR